MSALLRLCLAVFLSFNILYAPIHLHWMPHSDEMDFLGDVSVINAPALMMEDGHDEDEHHERHPAAQHKLKLVKSERSVVEWMVIPAAAWVDSQNCRPAWKVFDFSGLSPPELVRSWQFFFRAALPVRAPSRLS